LSAYADDTTVFISAISQLQIIEDEFSHFGHYSAAILNNSKCVVFLLGIDLNWSNVLFKMRSRINHYRSIYKDSSLLFKAKILNTYVLPISYYLLKAVHPPDAYFEDVHKIVCNFLWEGKRHWVKPLFVYLPVEIGGLGVKNNYVQYLIFKQRALLKCLNPNISTYFLRSVRNLSCDILFNNKTTNICFNKILFAFNILKFKFKKVLNANDFRNIGLTNQLYFPETNFPFLLSVNFK